MFLFVELEIHDDTEGSKGMVLLQVHSHLFLTPKFGKTLRDVTLDGKGYASGSCLLEDIPKSHVFFVLFFSYSCPCSVHLLKSFGLCDYFLYLL